MADHFYSVGDVEGLLALEVYMSEQGHDTSNISYYIKVKLQATPLPLNIEKPCISGGF